MSQDYHAGPDRTSRREEEGEHSSVAAIVVLVVAAIVIFALLVFLFAAWGMGEWLKAGSGIEAIFPRCHL